MTASTSGSTKLTGSSSRLADLCQGVLLGHRVPLPVRAAQAGGVLLWAVRIHWLHLRKVAEVQLVVFLLRLTSLANAKAAERWAHKLIHHYAANDCRCRTLCPRLLAHQTHLHLGHEAKGYAGLALERHPQVFAHHVRLLRDHRRDVTS
eukprot:CAMPEP_0179199930 /NCGR_PEP_ID=MMETSP0796-20121207/99477_1 /TAXON_ID=73915 /ORGANISM="Pyrodinium bahamense, Strain pbaha01" /LENGTH=148 /DNA_ID=CAMNT_0020904443 /DNA_START=112 /DNA_END=559 /DNA_ORIENTATION=-